jgi:hypothetical protein
MVNQHGDVRTPFAQRWQMHRHNIQAEIKVFAKCAFSICRFKIAVRGSDDANIHTMAFVASDRPDFPLLQYAQEFGLHFER